MRCALLLTALALSGLLVTPAGASGSSIGVFFDPDATDCDISVAPLSTFNVYVSAILGADAAGAGISGAEFRVDGLTQWVTAVAPNPAASLSLGDPTAGWCAIAFPTCMGGEESRGAVLLYTITCLTTFPVSPVTATVMHHALPCDSCFPCRWAPCVTLCDDPVFTTVLVSGGQALINNGACTVGVQPSAWGRVKSLYRG